MNTPAPLLSKLGTIGWIVIFVIAMGVLLWYFRPTSWFGLIMFLSTGIPVGVGIYWMYHVNTRTAAWEQIRQEGIAGSARVVKSESTNLRVNKQAQVRLQLAVQLPGAQPYEVTHVDVVPLGHAVTPGQMLSVYVDRNDHQRLIIDWTVASAEASTATPPNADVAARLAKLEALHRAGQITAEEYDAQRKRILSEL
jgi:hypothetical protein